MKFLSESGLTYFLNKLKGLFLTITDFNKVYDNGVVDAKQIVHKTNSGSSTNYDLVLGNKTDDESDSYIKIDSTRSITSNGHNKFGNIDINTKNSLRVNADSNVTIASEYNRTNDDSRYGIIEITDSVKPAMRSSNILSGSEHYNELTVYDEGIALKSCYNYKGTNYSDNSCMTFRVDYDNIYVFKGISKYDNNSDKLLSIETAHNTNDTDKIQFLRYKEGTTNTSTLDIRPTQIKCWTDAFSIKKDKEVRFKTSGSNSVRLTEGQGFKVFANMYAMPDHATDISEYTEEEQQLLANNTVQKLILKLNSSKASAKTVKKIAKQTIQQPNVCVRKAININSVGDNVIYYHKGTPSIKLKPGNYRIFVDNQPVELDLPLNNGKNITSLGNNIYKVDNNDSNKIWKNLYYLPVSTVNYYRRVVNVVHTIENDVEFTEVKIDTLSDKYLNGVVNTTSPYFSIVSNNIVSNIAINVINDGLISYSSKYSDDKILVGVLKHDVIKAYDTTDKSFKYAGHRHKYHIVNKTGMIGRISRRLHKHRGTGILKYYHKGIIIGERNVSIYDGSIN